MSIRRDRDGKFCFRKKMNEKYTKGLESIKQAVRAIAIHDCECYNCIDFEKDPIGFLLLLCDEMQEWDRRIMVGSKVEAEADYIDLRGIEVTEEGIVLSDYIDIGFCYTAKTLVDTDWEYQKFFLSKQKALERLRFSKDFPIKQVKFRISIVTD